MASLALRTPPATLAPTREPSELGESHSTASPRRAPPAACINELIFQLRGLDEVGGTIMATKLARRTLWYRPRPGSPGWRGEA